MGGPIGAQVRCELLRETWRVRRQGDTRYVECPMEYRPVTWPVLLEKAFAAYLEYFEPDGADRDQDENQLTPDSGYDILVHEPELREHDHAGPRDRRG